MINPTSPSGATLGVKKHNQMMGNVVIGTGAPDGGLDGGSLSLNSKKNSGAAQYARGKKELQNFGLLMG